MIPWALGGGDAAIEWKRRSCPSVVSGCQGVGEGAGADRTTPQKHGIACFWVLSVLEHMEHGKEKIVFKQPMLCPLYI